MVSQQVLKVWNMSYGRLNFHRKFGAFHEVSDFIKICGLAAVLFEVPWIVQMHEISKKKTSWPVWV